MPKILIMESIFEIKLNFSEVQSKALAMCLADLTAKATLVRVGLQAIPLGIREFPPI